MELLSRIAQAFTHEDLLSGVGAALAVLLVVALRFLLPASDRGKMRAPVGFLIAHAVFAIIAGLLPEGSAHTAAHAAAVLMLLISLGRGGFVLLVDSILSRRLSRPVPKIFRDICEGLVYTAAVLIMLRAAGAQLDALLTTSALLTAIIGLSLQDTLGNLFAGLSIQAQNPFEVGDWIQYNDDPEVIGKVLEINWRATRVLTLDDVEIIIPNGPLARTPIRNFTKPTKVSRRSLTVVVPFNEAPHRVQQAILNGLDETDGVLQRPPPSVITSDFTERGVTYWVRFFTDDFDAREVTDGLARDRIWYALRRAGVEIAVPVADIDVSQDDESARARTRTEAQSRREQALRKVDFCRVLEDGQLKDLARFARERPYAPGELVIRKGETGSEFFIVQDGEVAVVLGEGGDEVEVARLEAGSFFGEMSVMTGDPRTASVRTVTETQLLVVAKSALEPILEESPQLAEQITEVLSERQEQLDAASSKSAATRMRPKTIHERNELLHRIKEFFSLSDQ